MQNKVQVLKHLSSLTWRFTKSFAFAPSVAKKRGALRPEFMPENALFYEANACEITNGPQLFPATYLPDAMIS